MSPSQQKSSSMATGEEKDLEQTTGSRLPSTQISSSIASFHFFPFRDLYDNEKLFPFGTNTFVLKVEVL